MTAYLPSLNPHKFANQRMPDMLTDEAEAMHQKALDYERRKLLKVIRLLARDLNTHERHYGRFEMDEARAALLTEDEVGNVTVRVES
jgi:hypothetical protein